MRPERVGECLDICDQVGRLFEVEELLRADGEA